MPDIDRIPEVHPEGLSGTVVFTGRLAAMTQEEAAELVRSLGGSVTDRPPRSGCTVVAADDARERERRGDAPRALARARELARDGAPVRIVAERDFLRSLGLEEPEEGVHRYYTTGQLGRILDVPRDRIRGWIRAGLMRPVKVVHGLAYFDFRQVRQAKTLAELTRAGVSVRRIRETLGSGVGPEGRDLATIELVPREGGLLVRSESGALFEPSGQLVFDLEGAGGREGPTRPEPRSIDDWLDLALHHEQAGRLEDAEHAYRRALSIAGPQPVLCFNLANVLYAMGRAERAAERFSQAVEADPEYVEAWNNLGNVLGDLDELEGAIHAYSRAIELAPDYPDPHYNLAETYRLVGDAIAARKHWRRYLEIDPHSPWADRIRDEIRSIDSEVGGATPGDAPE